MKRTVIAVITILLFAALLSGCVAAQPPGAAPAAQPAGEAASQPAAGGAQKLIWSVEGVNELPGLDPANPQNAQSIQAINLIFGGLVKLDDQLQCRARTAPSRGRSRTTARPTPSPFVRD